ncbi:MAG: hypothetical protein Aureis2KO_11650 [Aureisphaera sp.]
MKNIILIAFTFVSVMAFGQKEIGYVLMNDGSKELIYDGANAKKKTFRTKALSANTDGPVAYGFRYLHYYDVDGKIQEVNADDFEKAVIGDEEYVYLSFRHKKKKYRKVSRLVATSDTYLLVNYYGLNANQLMVVTHEKEIIEDKIVHSLINMKGKSKKAIEKVREYFGDCQELMERLEENFSHQEKVGIGGRLNRLLFYVEEGNDKEVMRNYITHIDCSN